MSSPRVTVIMRAKNSDWVIAQALSGLFSQDYRDFELLVVDSGSTDRTLEIVRQYPCRLVEIPAGNYYPGAVLNDAIGSVATELVVLQNSDVVPLNPSALGNLVAAFDDPAVVAAYARQLPRPEADTWVRRDYAVSFPPSGPGPEWITLSFPLAGMRRSAWEQRRFYTDAWGSEDTEWGHWATGEGLVVRYVPESVVMHSHNYTLTQLTGRRFIEGEADAFIYGGRDTMATALRRALAATIRDIAPHVAAGDWRGLLETPARRWVYSWAYHRGHVHGEERIASGSKDVTTGQRMVLDRHESVRGPK